MSRSGVTTRQQRRDIGNFFNAFQIMSHLFMALPRQVYSRKYKNPRCMLSHKNPQKNVGQFFSTFQLHRLDKFSFKVMELL